MKQRLLHRIVQIAIKTGDVPTVREQTVNISNSHAATRNLRNADVCDTTGDTMSNERSFARHTADSWRDSGSRAEAHFLLGLLTLVTLAFGPRWTEAATLGAPTFSIGQEDSEFGYPPQTGFPPVCAPRAEPAVAVATSVQLGGQDLQEDVNYNDGLNDKTDPGVQAFVEPLSAFFHGLLPPGSFLSKPQLLYDRTGDPSGVGRFVHVATGTTPASKKGWILFSSTFIPQGLNGVNDCTFVFDANFNPGGTETSYFPDEARLGMSRTDLVITAEMKSYVDGSAQGAKVWVIPKASVYNVPLQNCATSIPHAVFPMGLQNSDGTRAVAVIPAKSYDSSSIVNLISANPNGGSALNLWTLDTHKLLLFPGLRAKAVATPSYSNPPSAPQKGTSTLITTGGPSAPTELVNAVYQPTSGLWTVHTAACPSGSGLLGSCVKWYQINPTTPAVTQAGYFGYSNAYVYAPFIAVNTSSEVVIPFEASSSSLFVGAYYAGRSKTDPPGKLEGSGFLLSAPPLSPAGPYQRTSGTDEFSHSINAPGLRSAGDVDPDNDSLFWVYGAYASGLNMTCPNNTPNYDWSTVVGKAAFIGAAETKTDTTPPRITVAATTAMLRPPNGDIVPITVIGTMTDDEPEGTGVNSGSATYRVIDSYGQVQPHGNITLGPDGGYTFTTQLQASRNGNDKDGRRYTILVNALDNAGNKGAGFALVTVPHDHR